MAKRTRILMANKWEWSPETKSAREEATAAIHKFLQSSAKDIIANDPDVDEDWQIDGMMLTSWVVVGLFQNGIDEPEYSKSAMGDSGLPLPFTMGLLADGVNSIS